ncbi:hypothetical protein PoHVEF18_000917 [Penicillium ochrochloron]
MVTYRPTFIDGLLYDGPWMNKALLNAIYFSSSLYSDRTSVRSASAARLSAGARYYHRFRELLSGPDDQTSIPTAMGLVICAASLLSRGHGREAIELRKKARHMLVKLELDSIDSAPKYKFPLTKFPHEIEKEINNRLRLGIFALDTLITLYLGEPIASHLPMLPMGRMRDNFEENQD